MQRPRQPMSRRRTTLREKSESGYISSGDESFLPSNPIHIAQKPNPPPQSGGNPLRRAILRLQRHAPTKPNLVDDLLHERITCSEFAEEIERLSIHSRVAFVTEWAKLLKSTLSPTDGHFPAPSQLLAAKAIPSPRASNIDVPTIHLQAYDSHTRLQNQNGTTSHVQFASHNGPALHTQATPYGLSSQQTQVIPRQIHLGLPSHNHQSLQPPQTVRRVQSRENMSAKTSAVSLHSANGSSSQLAGGAPLPPLKSNTAEAVAALAPYISRYAHKPLPTADSSLLSSSPSKTPFPLDFSKNDTALKDLPHDQLHLLKAITALAFASEPGGPSGGSSARTQATYGYKGGNATSNANGDAATEVLRLLQSEDVVAPERIVRVWGLLSAPQQLRWVQSVVQQLVRLHAALSLFRRVTEETHYKRAVTAVLSAVAETVGATLVSFYHVRPSDTNSVASKSIGNGATSNGSANGFLGGISPLNGLATSTTPRTSAASGSNFPPMQMQSPTIARELRIEASTGPFDPARWIPAGYGIAGRVAHECHMLHVQDAASDPRFASTVDGAIPPHTAVLSIPLRPPSSPSASHFSILQICAASFSPEDILLLESIAGHLAVILGSVQARGREITMRRKFQALVQISNTITAELDLAALIALMRQQSKELLEADKCTLFLILPDDRLLWTRLAEGKEITFPMSSGIAGYVATTGNVVNIPDAYKDPRFRPDVDVETGYRTKSILCMPVKARDGNIIGAIQMINKAKGSFGEEDEELLTAFASHAAVVIVNSQAYQKELLERKKFQALSQIMDVISCQTELEPLIEILRQKSKELLDCDKCTLFLLNDDTKELHTRLAEGVDVHFPISQGIAGYVVSTGETLNIVDAYADPRFNKEVDLETGYKTNNILCMPVRNGQDGTIVGAIQMVNKRQRPFGRTDEEILQAFSAHAAVTISKARLYTDVMDANRTLENILKSIASFVITFSTEGLLSSYNHPPDELFGCNTTTMMSSPFWEWMHQSRNNQLVRDLEAVLRSSHPVRAKSYILHSADGATRIVNYSATPLIDEKTSPQSIWKQRRKTGVLLVIDDISDVSTMQQTIYDMESRMDELRTQVNSVVEAPIFAVIKTMEKLSRGELTMDVVRKELVYCIRMLGRSDIFRPDLPRMLEGVDSETKSMILLEYSHDVSYDNLNIVDSWPDIERITKNHPTSELDWDFDALSHAEDHLIGLIYNIFDHFKFMDLFHIPGDKLRSFILSVRSHYRKNPFHNFYHAFTVIQITYLILVKTDVMQYLSNLDIFSLLLAALCHDLEHPGVNNSFEVNSHSPLALLYNDISVQESHHCSVGFHLMRKAENNVLSGLSVDEFKDLRKTIVTSILATDMAQHFDITGKFKSALTSKGFSRESRDDRLHLCAIILHAADLSNPIRPPVISEKWARMLRDEFFAQTQKEKELQLPVTPFMVIEDDFTLAKNEVGFIDFVVRPLWEALAGFLPDLRVCIDFMDANKAAWQRIMTVSPRKA
eukprot:TRINITY_DN4337_c0_g1_i3.p1 TRINITY_DN4337_c0_g1~~TRINITY_DN4337_c0_g1_i3.p1  ORF type:complete len:1502 (-),score=336.03 TRINITY_DN4337_c0_g1_i3:3170-7675(-)